MLCERSTSCTCRYLFVQEMNKRGSGAQLRAPAQNRPEPRSCPGLRESPALITNRDHWCVTRSSGLSSGSGRAPSPFPPAAAAAQLCHRQQISRAIAQSHQKITIIRAEQQEKTQTLPGPDFTRAGSRDQGLFGQLMVTGHGMSRIT